VSDARPRLLPEVGLCSACRHARPQAGARGARFWRCERASADAAFRRYPPLPVRACGGFEHDDAGASLAAPAPRRDVP
jgi:hypothetical protein